MADRATGPVKPPVIDLTARNSRPDAEPKPAAPERPARARLDGDNWPLLTSIAVAGAVLGTMLTYLVATVLPLPGRQQALPPDLTPQMTAASGRLDALESGLGELSNSATRTQVSLDATIAQLDGDMKSVDASIADVKTLVAAAPPPVDLAPLEAELKTLRTQVDAIGAGASGADAGAIAQNLASLEAGMGSLTARLNGADSTLAALRTDLDATRKSLGDHIDAALPNEVGPALKLPLILSGLESAFANGKPFDAELRSLAAVLPGFAVPQTLKSASTTGLSRPDAVLQRLEATLPEILAARGPSTGDWVQNATDWVKSLLALRPAGEMEGDSPEAVVSRLEGAVTRRDFAAAATLLDQLPAPMQQAAAPVAGDIAAHAEADRLVADLRAKALSTAETTP